MIFRAIKFAAEAFIKLGEEFRETLKSFSFQPNATVRKIFE